MTNKFFQATRDITHRTLRRTSYFAGVAVLATGLALASCGKEAPRGEITVTLAPKADVKVALNPERKPKDKDFMKFQVWEVTERGVTLQFEKRWYNIWGLFTRVNLPYGKRTEDGHFPKGVKAIAQPTANGNAEVGFSN